MQSDAAKGVAPHTPGPWKATCSNPTRGADVWWISGNTGAHNRERDIGYVVGGSQHSDADARLIAAAPELLIAAKEAAIVIAGMAKAAGADPMQGTCLPRLMAAIAKATAAT